MQGRESWRKMWREKMPRAEMMARNKQALSTTDTGSRITVIYTDPQNFSMTKQVSFTDMTFIGSGFFANVYKARLCDTDEEVAIKRVREDTRYMFREANILRKLDHQNIVKLLFVFNSDGETKNKPYVNLILELVPQTLHTAAKVYRLVNQGLPSIYIKVYMFQIFRGLAYIHSKAICHRDIKPENILVCPETAVLKICDFGSSKKMIMGVENCSYIVTRFYRAPELFMDWKHYTFSIDTWSAGCVLAELLLREPIFKGKTGKLHLKEIAQVLGSPSEEEIFEMNPKKSLDFPEGSTGFTESWSERMHNCGPPEAINLIRLLLVYRPSRRIEPFEALAHAFFDELRDSSTRLPNGKDLPPLFNFSACEIARGPHAIKKVLPPEVLLNEAADAAPGYPAALQALEYELEQVRIEHDGESSERVTK